MAPFAWHVDQGPGRLARGGYQPVAAPDPAAECRGSRADRPPSRGAAGRQKLIVGTTARRPGDVIAVSGPARYDRLSSAP